MTEEEAKAGSGQGDMNGGRPYTLDVLAERWECTGAHVRRLCTAGKLRHFKIGNLYRIPVDAVLEFEVGHYGEDKATSPVGATMSSEKDDPVAAYIRSYRERISALPGGPVLPLPLHNAKDD
ncbi:MAG: helix-turn-helix domain-containing protein [Proteobacteria bacterium]|nr:helix-turn-helix domain-containing protein [Pseudomonadota bacterium]